MRFDGRIVLIVGGNSGIGLAAAHAFAEEGATTILVGRDRATLDAAAAAIPGSSAFSADIADPATLAPVLDEIGRRHGRIDTLFVNAGIGGFAPVRAITADFWDRVHDVNLRGCVFAVQAALPLMARGGSIVLTGSIGAEAAIPGNAVYAAAKAGLAAFARILAKEVVDDGIRVNMVSPGPIETPLITRNIGMADAEVAAFRETITSAVPMRRIGTPEEVARAVLFLASDEASFVTGADLLVDGGALNLR